MNDEPRPIRVLAVEDSEDDALLLARELQRGGYEPSLTRVETAGEMEVALDGREWDVILADYSLPRFSGMTALELVRSRGLDVPFLIVSGAIGEETAVSAMKAGAHDYIMKDNLARLVSAVEREMKDAEVRRERGRAEESNAKLLTDLEEMFVSVVKALTSAIDAKSPWTKGHSERVTYYAVRIASKMGVGGSDIERLRLAGFLHDIGKIGTLDDILDKPGRLTDSEFNLVKKHPDMGVEILSPIKQFKDILPIIRHHHEHWDGTGYPAGLRGECIPLLARIMSVADSFDSMMADRPYRPAPGFEYAVSEFLHCRGTQYDPAVVDAFLEVIGRTSRRS